MREEQRARLHRLADSINDTARMTRTSLSLMLLVALYLVLTLVASTDQNLLLNGPVTLPLMGTSVSQMGIGVTIAQSYIFAPLIFLYLHIQLLFLLSVLARKINTFETALKEEFTDAIPPHARNKTEAERGECWEWLSAFAFVQLFRRTPGMPRALKMVARTLAWFGIEAAPLALLFLIAVSFVRYQSDWITWSHHCIFILDSVFINWLVFRRRDRIQGNSASVSVAAPGKADGTPAFGVGQWPALLGRIRRAKGMLAWLWTSVGWTGRVALGVALLLICCARPPHFDPQSVVDDRKSIWRGDDRGFLQAVWKNPLDAGPCHWWGFGCRYLDVSNKWLLSAQPEDLVGAISDEITPETFGDVRRFHLGSPDLARRRLHFARFESAYLPGADLRQTELQGADFQGAELQGANLEGAELQGADFQGAELQGANLEGAELQGADFQGAELQGANLEGAELQGATLARAKLRRANLRGVELQEINLRGIELQGADLEGAGLQGADLKGVGLQGANLQKAELEGANLSEAKLQGANLRKAGLRGARLVGAELQGANLGEVELEGANLRDAALQGSEGQPASWYPTWMPDVKFDFSGSPEQYLKEFLSDDIRNMKLAWKNSTLQEHLKQSLSDSGSDRDIFAKAEGAVFYKPKGKNWKGENCPDASDVNPDDCYWDAWAEWTAEFACENEYTARSSLQRWSLPEYRGSQDTPSRYEREFSDRARIKVRQALFDARKDPECAGLSDLSKDEWQVFVGG